MKRSLPVNVLLYFITLALVFAAMFMPVFLYGAAVSLFGLRGSDLWLSALIGVGLLAGLWLLRRKWFGRKTENRWQSDQRV